MLRHDEGLAAAGDDVELRQRADEGDDGRTGGVTPENLAAYRLAGADGFGIGSALYRPGMSPPELAQKATVFAAAVRQAG
ncbi:MAG: hypothetical protein ACREEP_02260 [Dongiaceae bacterium]